MTMPAPGRACLRASRAWSWRSTAESAGEARYVVRRCVAEASDTLPAAQGASPAWVTAGTVSDQLVAATGDGLYKGCPKSFSPTSSNC